MINGPPIYCKTLSAGTLTVTPTTGSQSLDSLFDIAERRNPKRAFLFVSKVLGRHIPIAPSVMRSTYRQLAQQLPPDLPQPVLFIGMAETAVGLGAGVFDEALSLFNNAVYLTSTRYAIAGELLCEFKENHSHATDHLLYRPADPLLRARVQNARSLVLIDDEATTGNTFINLLTALRTEAGLSQVEQVVTVTLTDWSGNAIKQQCPLPVTTVSLVQGDWHWQPRADAAVAIMPDVNVTAIGSVAIVGKQSWGRLGMASAARDLGKAISASASEKILVLGSAEFVWEPLLLAERLEQLGAEVKFSCTTRSPIATGYAIESVIAFSDNYGLGIANYIYNVAHQQFDRILLCVETPAQSVDPALLVALQKVATEVEVVVYE